MGRKPKQRTPTAYDYRRTILLVQLLAQPDHTGFPYLQLCREWGVEPFYMANHITGQSELYPLGTLRKLAQHALEYSREQSKDTTP